MLLRGLQNLFINQVEKIGWSKAVYKFIGNRCSHHLLAIRQQINITFFAPQRAACSSSFTWSGYHWHHISCASRRLCVQKLRSRKACTARCSSVFSGESMRTSSELYEGWRRLVFHSSWLSIENIHGFVNPL